MRVFGDFGVFGGSFFNIELAGAGEAMMDTQEIVREKVRFTNAEGVELAGLLERPSATPKAYALFAHCFTCSKNVLAATRISRALAERGYGVLRFDFTGLGNSEGDFANTNFTSNVRDLVAAADFMKAHYAPVDLLVGHSLGGAAVLAAAESVPGCEAVVTLAAPSDPAHVRHTFKEHIDDIRAKGSATVCLAGREFTIQKQFLDDIENHRLKEKIGGLKKALLVLHSPFDEVVDIEHAAEIFQAAKHPKSFISLDRADHLLSEAADAEFAAEMMASWAGRYVRNKTIDETRAADEVPAGEVQVEEVDGGLTNRVRTHSHRLLADEPEKAGGRDRGPDPYGYLLTALGACTSMTLRLYANHKQLPLEGVRIHLRHRKIHAEDCESCETKSGKLDRIERRIELIGKLDEVQRKRLLEIADKCPVHRTLTSEVQIISRLVQG